MLDHHCIRIYSTYLLLFIIIYYQIFLFDNKSKKPTVRIELATFSLQD